ncbi:hypothetical protein Taro_013753, partial [Colocasia esculenta]|nr:hypothetical protein [Colocasia esculenta]
MKREVVVGAQQHCLHEILKLRQYKLGVLQGDLVPDHMTFPSRIKVLADHIHEKGLKLVTGTVTRDGRGTRLETADVSEISTSMLFYYVF